MSLFCSSAQASCESSGASGHSTQAHRCQSVSSAPYDQDNKIMFVVMVMLDLLSFSYYEEGGFSTLAVDSMRVDMGEILSRVIRKRRLQIHGE